MPRSLRLILIIVCPVMLLVGFAIFRLRTTSVDKATTPTGNVAVGISARKLGALVSELSDPKSSDKAVPEIERLVNSEPQLRSALANAIRPIIYTSHSQSRPWKNAMRLAGDLKIVELAPDMANFIDRRGSEFVETGSVSEELPAGTALAKMGDPAIPALVRVAQNGSRPQQLAAPMFIAWIRTPKAHQALESLLNETKDPEAKREIEAYLHAFGLAPEELEVPPSCGGSAQGISAQKPPQGNGAMPGLISELSDPKLSDKAVPEIQRLVNSEPQLRSALATAIRLIICTARSHSRPWKNAMRLAGNLKIVDLAQDIANFVGRPGSDFTGIDVTEEEPAGAALVKMGDPAIPALVHVAENGTPRQRHFAPMYIAWIRTPKACQALERLWGQAKDPENKKWIELQLRQFGQVPQELKGLPSLSGSSTQGIPAEKPPRRNGTMN